MERFLLGTNWKMHKTFPEAVAYTERLKILVQQYPQCQFFIIPPSLYLRELAERLKGGQILLGAQNMHWREEGDYTGEISPAWLEACGVAVAELGHSERRQAYNENDVDLNRKVHAAFRHNMIPLLCVGESAQDKEYGVTAEKLRMQLKIGLFGVNPEQSSRLWIAYEPVWAIGPPGIPAEAAYVQAVHQMIRSMLLEQFGESGRRIPILYGGSVNPENCVSLAVCSEVNGLFIGRSAWDLEKWMLILERLHMAGVLEG